MYKRSIRVQSGLSPPPHMAAPKHKSRILSKFQEEEIFGEQEIDLDDEFKTLKLSDLNQLEQQSTEKSDPKKPVHDYASDFEFDGDLPDLEFKLNEPVTEDIRLSPGTMSSSSRRKSLSEYSEDTDVTSNFNEEGFEDIDEVFGTFIDDQAPQPEPQTKPQPTKAEAADVSSLHHKLKSKKQQLQSAADKEEKELLRRYRNDEMATLKGPIREFDKIENDKTINYDYTRDDFDDFEQGFDLGGIDTKLQFKKSMPNIRTESRGSNMKKFQSSYNLNGYVNPKQTRDFTGMKSSRSGGNIHGFMENPSSHNNPKYDDKLMRKLDRIPSFSQKKLSQMMEKNENFRATKQQLLQQYQEIDKQHKRTNEKILNLKKSMSMPSRRGKKIGLVKYLGDGPVANTSTMRYNHESRNWEGNDIDLMKFNSLNTKKPSLIKFDDYAKENKKAQIPNSESNHNMVFDPVNLKWVSKGSEDDDVFKNVTELPEDPKRGVSTFTARTISTKVDEEPNVFIVSRKLIDRFLKEEIKIRRKTEYWFNKDDKYDLDADFNHDFYWDIRKLIMDNDK